MRDEANAAAPGGRALRRLVRPSTAGVLLVAAAVLYCDWLTALLLPTHLDPARVTLSAIAAQGQPYAWVYRAQDVACGVLALVAVPGLVAALLRGSRGAAGPAAGCGWSGGGTGQQPREAQDGDARRAQVLTGVGAFATFGAATVVDALVPLRCAAGDPRCSVHLSGGTSPADVHAMTSTLSVAGLFLAILLVSTGLRDDAAWRRFARGWLLALPPLVAVALYSGLGSLTGALPGLGVDEWVMVTGLALWPATVGVRLVLGALPSGGLVLAPSG